MRVERGHRKTDRRRLAGTRRAPHSLRFFDHDRQLASAGDDGTIRIWNLADSFKFG